MLNVIFKINLNRIFNHSFDANNLFHKGLVFNCSLFYTSILSAESLKIAKNKYPNNTQT